ncbi:hypothetical protein [Prosthecobacter sp.]|uniref:hypothetical protein n=1 Tax=Prosthecobacter sp. TaxID=1965333 RepID=UPI003783FD96
MDDTFQEASVPAPAVPEAGAARDAGRGERAEMPVAAGLRTAEVGAAPGKLVAWVVSMRGARVSARTEKNLRLVERIVDDVLTLTMEVITLLWEATGALVRRGHAAAKKWSDAQAGAGAGSPALAQGGQERRYAAPSSPSSSSSAPVWMPAAMTEPEAVFQEREAAFATTPAARSTGASDERDRNPDHNQTHNRNRNLQPSTPMSENTPPATSLPIAQNLPSFLASVGMGAAFFMPWMTVMGAFGVSGSTLGNFGGQGQAAWVVLILAVLSAIMHFVKPSKGLNVLAGVVPFFMLMYFASKIGKDLFQVLSIGAWLTLGCGLVLIIAPVKGGGGQP